MIDLVKEKPIPLSRAAAMVPSASGQGHAHVSTIHRWITRGQGGIKLEAVRLGGRWVTTMEAIARFTERLTEAYTGTPAPKPPPPSSGLAGKALAAAGW